MNRALFIGLALAACSPAEPPINDDALPSIEVETPARGSHAEGDAVVVSGHATDLESGIDRVVVNGVVADLDDDGRFKATITLEPGVTILETVAFDVAGNEAADHRGVLAGMMAPIGTTARDALVADLNPATFAAIGEVAGAATRQIDFAVIGDSVSPIVDRGNSCFGVEVDLRDVSFTDLDIALSPTSGAVEVRLTATDLDVDMRANWELSCFGGGAGVNISADELVITGNLGISLVSGRFVATLEDASASFSGFDLDVGSIPDSIVNFFVDDIDQKVAGALIGVIDDLVPSVVEDALDGFRNAEVNTTILGADVTLALTPTMVEIGDQGGRIALDFAASSPSIEGASYLATPQVAPESEHMSGESLGLAVADDAANQMLALLWHSGALDAELDAAGSILGDVFPGAATVSIELPLAPVITTREGEPATVGIADLFVTAADANGETLARIALSGLVEVGVELDDLGFPRLGADLATLATSVLAGENNLGLRSDQIDVIAEVGISQLRSQLGKVLGQLTIPQFGAEIRSPTLGATRGYLLVSGKISVK